MMPGQTIQLNGKTHPVSGPVAVAELLASLGLAGRPVVVELDGRALASTDHLATVVHPGARLEIVRLAAGG